MCSFFFKKWSIYLNNIFFGFETLVTRLLYVDRFSHFVENKLQNCPYNLQKKFLCGCFFYNK